MNKKGTMAAILVILIAIVLSSALTLALVKAGVLKPKSDQPIEVLNAEFIPGQREGYLVIKDFQFCAYVDEKYACQEEKESFKAGEDVYFRFMMESSTYRGEVWLVENYRLKGPGGNVLLEVEEKFNNYYTVKSGERKEEIPFKDYLVSEGGEEKGEYTLELVVENPLLNKKVVLVKMFKVGAEV